MHRHLSSTAHQHQNAWHTLHGGHHQTQRCSPHSWQHAPVASLAPRCWWHHTQHAARTVTAANAAGSNADEDDDDDFLPGKPMRVERLLANLGYGKRRDCQTMVKKGRAVRKDGSRFKVGDKVYHHEVVLDGEELDPPFPFTLMLHKPVGYVVTSPEDKAVSDPTIYDLLPHRYGSRKPFLSAVGRLDKDTSGLLILTDDGQLVHKIKSPKQGIWKVYVAKLAAPMTAEQVAAAKKKFAKGGLVLPGEIQPLLPAALTMLDDSTAQLSICEGRYHQVRLMFNALGHEVVALHRTSVGGLQLPSDLTRGGFRVMSAADIQAVFSGPTSEQVLGTQPQAQPTGGPSRRSS